MSNDEKKGGAQPLNESYIPPTKSIHTYNPESYKGTYTPPSSGETGASKGPPEPNKK